VGLSSGERRPPRPVPASSSNNCPACTAAPICSALSVTRSARLDQPQRAWAICGSDQRPELHRANPQATWVLTSEVRAQGFLRPSILTPSLAWPLPPGACNNGCVKCAARGPHHAIHQGSALSNTSSASAPVVRRQSPRLFHTAQRGGIGALVLSAGAQAQAFAVCAPSNWVPGVLRRQLVCQLKQVVAPNSSAMRARVPVSLSSSRTSLPPVRPSRPSTYSPISARRSAGDVRTSSLASTPANARNPARIRPLMVPSGVGQAARRLWS